MPKMSKHKQSGFTLVELVMVIILLGVIGTFSSRFIADNVVLYQSSVNQNERLNDARFVINRMSKELDSAIAFSVVVNNTNDSCMSFVPFTAAGQYLNDVRNQDNVSLIMDKKTRDLSGSNSDDFKGQYMSIYTTNATDFDTLPSDTVALITDYNPVSGANQTQANVELSTELVRNSATFRYFIAKNKVRYCLVGTELYRSQVLLGNSFSSRILMADNLHADSSMSLTSATQFSNAILELNFDFLLRDGNVVKFEHQVVMTNVP